MDTAKLRQLIYFKNVLASEWKSINTLYWGKGLVSLSTGNRKLWLASKLIKTRFGQGRPPENLGYRHEEKKKENCKTVDVYADPSTWEHLWDWMRYNKSC